MQRTHEMAYLPPLPTSDTNPESRPSDALLHSLSDSGPYDSPTISAVDETFNPISNSVQLCPSSSLETLARPSLSRTSSVKSSIQPTKRRQPLFKHRWLWEICSAFFSIACITAVLVILIETDDTSLSAWKFPIALNALVSTFLTLSKTALMVPVAACISQLKWIHFEKANRVNELEVFEEASRGPWGSMELLFRLKHKTRALLAIWGCIITISALAMDPFAQQILNFPIRQTLTSKANVGAYLSSAHILDSGLATSYAGIAGNGGRRSYLLLSDEANLVLRCLWRSTEDSDKSPNGCDERSC